MIHDLWTRKQFALAAAIVSLGIVAAVLAIGLAYSEPFTDAGLGPEWQCSKVAFVFTTCDIPTLRWLRAPVLGCQSLAGSDETCVSADQRLPS